MTGRGKQNQQLSEPKTLRSAMQQAIQYTRTHTNHLLPKTSEVFQNLRGLTSRLEERYSEADLLYGR